MYEIAIEGTLEVDFLGGTPQPPYNYKRTNVVKHESEWGKYLVVVWKIYGIYMYLPNSYLLFDNEAWLTLLLFTIRNNVAALNTTTSSVFSFMYFRISIATTIEDMYYCNT